MTLAGQALLLTPGRWTLRFTARDGAGNRANCSTRVDVRCALPRVVAKMPARLTSTYSELAVTFPRAQPMRTAALSCADVFAAVRRGNRSLGAAQTLGSKCVAVWRNSTLLRVTLGYGSVVHAGDRLLLQPSTLWPAGRRRSSAPHGPRSGGVGRGGRRGAHSFVWCAHDVLH